MIVIARYASVMKSLTVPAWKVGIKVGGKCGTPETKRNITRRKHENLSYRSHCGKYCRRGIDELRNNGILNPWFRVDEYRDLHIEVPEKSS